MALFKKSHSLTMTADSFDGIDCTKTMKSTVSSASYMKNFRITSDGRLKKRCGYKKLLAADGVLDAFVWGDFWIYLRRGALYAVNRQSGAETARLAPFYSYKIGRFTFDGKLYIGDDSFLYIFDGSSFTRVEPYIPTLATGAGVSGGGIPLESLNIISAYAKISYSPDGTSVTYVLPPYADGVVQVCENGVVMPASSYTYSSAIHAVTFRAAPAGGTADSLSVTFGVSGLYSANSVFTNKRFCVYGGKSDSRVFVYGGGDSKIYYSDVTATGSDCTYFPAENMIRVGDGTHAVTSVVRHYTTLAVFTDVDAWYISPSAVDYDGYEKMSFPVFPLNSRVGCTPDGGALINNTPCTVNANGVYLWTSTTVRDERNAKCISTRVFPLFSKIFSHCSFVFDNEREGELWICGKGGVCVYSYETEAWYYYDDIDASCVQLTDDGVFFADGGGLYLFDEDIYTDDGRGYDAVWESNFVTFGTHRKKELYRLFVSMIPQARSSVLVTVIPNASERVSAGEQGEFTAAVLDLGNLDFSRFTFECEGRPQLIRHRLRLHRFDSLKLRVENTTPGGRATVERIVLCADRI